MNLRRRGKKSLEIVVINFLLYSEEFLIHLYPTRQVLMYKNALLILCLSFPIAFDNLTVICSNLQSKRALSCYSKQVTYVLGIHRPCAWQIPKINSCWQRAHKVCTVFCKRRREHAQTCQITKKDGPIELEFHENKLNILFGGGNARVELTQVDIFEIKGKPYFHNNDDYFLICNVSGPQRIYFYLFVKLEPLLIYLFHTIDAFDSSFHKKKWVSFRCMYRPSVSWRFGKKYVKKSSVFSTYFEPCL
jgi:hypothetical protein